MKIAVVFCLVFLMSSCGGSLSDDQRKQLREGKETQSIQRVTDVEITEAAFEKGRSILKVLEDTTLSESQVDSIAAFNNVEIHWLDANSASGLALESQIIEAYIVSAATGSDQPDNIQKVGLDSLLYTKPVVVTMPDGVVNVKGTWNVWMTRKQLVLSMSK